MVVLMMVVLAVRGRAMWETKAGKFGSKSYYFNLLINLFNDFHLFLLDGGGAQCNLWSI